MQTIEFRCITTKGELKWMSAQPKVYFNLRGKVERIEGIVTDITHSKLAEITLKNNIAELQKTKQELEYKNTELDTFVYRASHDLRSPIASILGLCNLLEMEHHSDSATHFHQLIKRSTERLDEILKDLMGVMQMKENAISYTLINFEDILSQVKKNLKNLANYDAVEWEVQITLQNKIYSDAVILRTIIQHLVQNSINFARVINNLAYVRISITEDISTNMLCITVMDNGQGIPKEATNKIFTMFYKGSDDAKGSGLGLYILKNALDKLNGFVDVKTVLGAGTTFSIKIPNREDLFMLAQSIAPQNTILQLPPGANSF